MRAQLLKHEALGAIEYYLCDFKLEADIEAFKKTYLWFTPEPDDIKPGDLYVIKHDAEHEYFEIFTFQYFITEANTRAGVWSNIAYSARAFSGL